MQTYFDIILTYRYFEQNKIASIQTLVETNSFSQSYYVLSKYNQFI